MGMMLPLYHMGFLELVTMSDPYGIPAVDPFGHRHQTGQREALLPHEKKKHYEHLVKRAHA